MAVIIPESIVLSKIMLKASQLGMRLFRNQVGGYKLPDGTFLRSGLCKGSSDLIGWTRVEIKDHMIGKEIAIFTAVEVKKKGKRPSKEQKNFIKKVRESGGVAFVCDDVKNFEKDIDNIIK